MAEKKFFVPAENLKLLTEPMGACIATDRIMVDGSKVGYMYRELPLFPQSSGWMFTCGDEDPAYMDDPTNHGIYDVNTVCNYDKDIVPYLGYPAGSAFFRDENGVFQPERVAIPAEYLSADVMEEIENHVARYVGGYGTVLHEVVSEIIHNDIIVIPPGEKNPYYSLVTLGMSARSMAVPEEQNEEKLECCELMLCLPPDWPLFLAEGDLLKLNEDEEAYWPVRLLKRLAHFPFEYNTWLGYGHTVPFGEPFAGNTEMTDAIIAPSSMMEAEFAKLGVSTGSWVNFYCVLPLYTQEVEYKQVHGADALFAKYSKQASFVVDPHRTPLEL